MSAFGCKADICNVAYETLIPQTSAVQVQLIRDQQPMNGNFRYCDDDTHQKTSAICIPSLGANLACAMRSLPARATLYARPRPEKSHQSIEGKSQIVDTVCVECPIVAQSGRSSHGQAEPSNCLAFAISALPLMSLIFSFTRSRAQRASA
jgi:hypothetical protein